jgi:hypothetical protein
MDALLMSDERSAPTPTAVQFHYIKNPHFRVVHVDGAYGGPTPRGLIHVAVYSERQAIPQITEHQISSTGTLGDQEVISGREGIVREIDVDLMMTRQVAADLRDWLSRAVEQLDRLTNEAGGDVV